MGTVKRTYIKEFTRNVLEMLNRPGKTGRRHHRDSPEREDFCVMPEAIEQGSGHDLVAEKLGPRARVGRDQYKSSSVNPYSCFNPRARVGRDCLIPILQFIY